MPDVTVTPVACGCCGDTWRVPCDEDCPEAVRPGSPYAVHDHACPHCMGEYWRDHPGCSHDDEDE